LLKLAELPMNLSCLEQKAKAAGVVLIHASTITARGKGHCLLFTGVRGREILREEEEAGT
jgi:hypothetical protein